MSNLILANQLVNISPLLVEHVDEGILVLECLKEHL